MHKLPEHGMCFVCGKENPHGLGVVWYVHDDRSIFADIKLTEFQQGPPGLAHGGASAALLDEAMGASVWLAGHQAAAVNLNVDYRRPIPLGIPIKITASVVKQSGNTIHTQGEIRLPDGEVAVEGRGIFTQAKHLFQGLIPTPENSD